MPIEINKPREGWGLPAGSEVKHFFRDTRSLCGRWGFFFGTVLSRDDQSSNRCSVCRRLLERRAQREAREAS